MKKCRSCFYCVPNYKEGAYHFMQGTCYQAKRLVMADMAACSIYENRLRPGKRIKTLSDMQTYQSSKEREENMAVKSNSKKRNQYRDKDENLIPGVTIPEILDKRLTILAKREYTWGLFEGLAVKVRGPNGALAVVEITAEIPIKALCNPKLSKTPFVAKFIQKTSKNKKKYYTIEVLNENESPIQDEGTELPY